MNPFSAIMTLPAVLAACLPSAFAIQDRSADVANWLPPNCAMLVSLHQPAKLAGDFANVAGLNPLEAVEFARGICGLDVRELADEQTTQMEVAGRLLAASSIHLFITESRESIGEIGVLLEYEKGATPPNDEQLEWAVGFLCRRIGGALHVDSRLSGEINQRLSLFESGSVIDRFGDWIVVTTSPAVNRQVVDRLKGVPELPALAGQRSWQASLSAELPSACVSCYCVPPLAKGLLVVLTKGSEEAWEKSRYDELAWARFSLNHEQSEKHWDIRRQLVLASTLPFLGAQADWEFFRPFEAFPKYGPEKWQLVSGRCLDLPARNNRWLEESRQIPGSGEPPQTGPIEDPIRAFLNGTSRPTLGGHSVSFLAGKDDWMEFLNFREEDRQSAAESLGKYFADVDAGYRRAGYGTHFVEKPESLEWKLEIESDGAIGNLPGPGDFVFGDVREHYRTKQRRPAWTDRFGAVCDEWVVMGREKSVREALENPVASLDAIPGLLQEVAGQFGLSHYHGFEVRQASAVERSWIHGMGVALTSAYSDTWLLSETSFKKALADEAVRNLLSFPQAAGVRARELVNRIAAREGLMDIRLEAVQENRYLYVSRMRIPNVRQPASR